MLQSTEAKWQVGPKGGSLNLSKKGRIKQILYAKAGGYPWEVSPPLWRKGEGMEGRGLGGEEGTEVMIWI